MLGRSTKSWSLGSHRCWLSGARHRARHHPRRRIRLHQLRLHRRPHLRLSHLRLHPHRPRLAFSTAGGVRRFRSRSAERDGGSLVSNFELLDRLELRSFWAGRGACANGLADLASVGLWTKRRYADGTSGRRGPTRMDASDGIWHPFLQLLLPPRRRIQPMLRPRQLLRVTRRHPRTGTRALRTTARGLRGLRPTPLLDRWRNQSPPSI